MTPTLTAGAQGGKLHRFVGGTSDAHPERCDRCDVDHAVHWRPLAIDLYCGLGGWAEGLLAEGYDVTGYDIEAHDYGTGGYPGKLVLRDIRTIHGSEFKDAALIVGSSPCQKYSYMAMPWKRAKALDAYYSDAAHPERLVELNELYDAQFRIQREASAAAGRHIPMVVENVRGAQKWVGRAAYHYGSFYLWGDVPALMPIVQSRKMKTVGPVHATQSELHNCHINEMRDSLKVPGFRFDGSGKSFQTASVEHHKTVGHANIRDGHTHTRHLTNQAESDGVKFSQSGDAWFDGKPRDKMLGDKGPAAYGSRSNSRKAASAMIAKIPFPLAQHIARAYFPRDSL